jgi:hypothetical protein
LWPGWCDRQVLASICMASEELEALPMLLASLIIAINDMIKKIMTPLVHCT